MKIDVEAEKKEILRQYRGLLRAAKYSKSRKDKKLIRKAFDVALEAHKDQRRKTGEPYIYHPIAVARIVAEEIGLGTTAIVCALLHDTVEDTEITLEDIERLFGEKVRRIIDGLTKISEIEGISNSIQAENFKKILLTLSEDVRVILIKLADRLHNMRTLDSMKRHKQLKIASETLFLYAPLAHRLGLHSIKSELEDLSLKYTEPEAYNEIVQKLKKSQAVRTRFINKFSLPIKKALEEQGFKFTIKGRTKSIYSIWNKMKKKQVPFEEVYDVFAIRIIIDSPPEKEKSDCWRVYSIVTDFYQPNPDRLRDWISIPKANGYESLHATVMSPTGKWVEVQIRTTRMDEIAEKGFAAHWKYKENNAESQLDAWLVQIREILEQAGKDENAIEFIDDFKLNLFDDEIFVFTPKGDMCNLAKGATALDFAFHIHTQVGYHCMGAKVNGKLVPISHPLRSGDQVEIITSRKQKPKEDWLKYVVTGRAKSKIKQALKEHKKALAKEGKSTLDRKFKHLGIRLTEENYMTLARFYKLTTPLDLFYQIAIDKINLHHFPKHEVKKGKLVLIKEHKAQKDNKNLSDILKIKGKTDDTLVIGEDMQQFDYTMAKCCNPIPGDEVFGFITINDGIKIHKTTCPNAVQLLSNYAYRVVKARWTSQEQIAFLAGIKVTGLDKVGIVNEITRIISNELNVNMRSITFDSNDGIFDGKIMVFVHDTFHLDNLMRKLRNVEGVIQVMRIENV